MGSIMRWPDLWGFLPHNRLTSGKSCGSKVRQLITYIVQDSFPLIKILDTINLAVEDTEVKFSTNSNTSCLLQKNSLPWLYNQGPQETQTCFGVKLIRR
ncbi:hypothetical protein ABBQ32_004280 [Trebouxia sp. C0010 RCD-2024]